MKYFKSFIFTIFIFTSTILIIFLFSHVDINDEFLLAMADDTVPPSIPLNVALVDYVLSWDAPTKNEDGTPLEDLAGYIVYYGTESSNYDVSYDVKNTTTYKVDNLTEERTYYFVITAYDTSGNESKYSEEIYFTKIPSQHTLSVYRDGAYTGVVTSSPEGISCGSDCNEVYHTGTSVILIAKPDTDSFFAGWSGGSCSGKGLCVLTINKDTIVTATFHTKDRKETRKELPQPQKPLDIIFTVQVGAFRNASYAKALVKRLDEKGYKAYITYSVSKEDKRLHKVRIGKFSNREKANSLSEKIKKAEGLDTFVTTF